jgi:asparagine synthase (glutamine-hydrolysing)
MPTELFGVFGGRDRFERLRSPEPFDVVVEGESVTVGVSDGAFGRPQRSAVHQDADGFCAVFGELYPPEWAESDPARWVYHHYQTTGERALENLNGSYVIVLEYDGEATVVTDQIRSRECFYTVESAPVFGTDAVNVARTVRNRTLDHDNLLEYLYLSVVLGEGTLYEQLKRVPFDGVLREEGVDRLDRFVYQSESFDYAAALADRIERAVDRRTDPRGSTGLLLSAGFDSRTLLATADVDVCYTVGESDSGEVRSAKRLAAQYDTPHVALAPDDRYLNTDPGMCRYTHGTKESLHVHHAGYESEMRTRKMLHGWMFDSLLREHFVPQRTVEVMGRTIPVDRLDPDVDPVEFATRKMGYLPEASSVHDRFRAMGVVDYGPESFVDATIQQEFECCKRAGETPHDTANRFGVKNIPSAPFRNHLIDTFEEHFVAADLDLVSWHLRTPPEHRNTKTFLEALDRIDGSLRDVRPPDRPHDRFLLNQAEKFLRKKVPDLEPFGTPWPDRRELYQRNKLDEVLFDDQPWLHDHSPRFKLRFHDVLCWLDAVEQNTVTPDALFDRRVAPLGA